MKGFKLSLVVFCVGLLFLSTSVFAGEAVSGEIAVIVKEATSSFWQNVEVGASDAEKELLLKENRLKFHFSVPLLKQKSKSKLTCGKCYKPNVLAIVLAPSSPDALVLQ